MSHFVYILQSEESGRYYVGASSDPGRRLRHHNSTSTGFTARYRPWELVFTQEFSTKEALAAEQPRHFIALEHPSGQQGLVGPPGHRHRRAHRQGEYIMTMEAPGTGGKLNEGAVKEHVVEGEGVFKPAPEWNEKPSSDRTRS